MALGGADRDRAYQLIHELNNSLGIVLNYTTLMGQDIEDQPGLMDDLGEIRTAGRRAAALVAELSAMLAPTRD